MTEISIQSKTDVSVRVPRLWNVTIYNDDFTPIDFVVMVLMMVFNKTEQEAASIALVVHEQGSSVIGIYSKDVAFTKCNRATAMSEQAGHPLMIKPEAN